MIMNFDEKLMSAPLGFWFIGNHIGLVGLIWVMNSALLFNNKCFPSFCSPPLCFVKKKVLKKLLGLGVWMFIIGVVRIF